MYRDMEIAAELAHGDDRANDTAEQIIEAIDTSSAADGAGALRAGLVTLAHQGLSRAGAVTVVAQLLADVYDHAEAEHEARAQA